MSVAAIMPSDMHDKRVIIISPDTIQNYEEVWEFQKRLCGSVGEGLEKEHLLLLEHEPVVTLGFHGNNDNLKIAHDELTKRGIKFFNIERGGDITFHGPGQVVAYPIIKLRERNYGVKEYVNRLEEAAIRTCHRFGVECRRIEGAPGVWTADSKKSPRKICALGIKVRKGVTMHGLALNVNTDLSYFSLINPCGFTSADVTSIARELNDENVPSIIKVKEVLKDCLLDLLF